MLIAGIGYALGRFRPIELGPIVALAVTVLVPAIIFDSLTRATLDRRLLGRLALHVLIQLLCIGAVSYLAARALAWDAASSAGLLLATLFSNSGNMGLALALFAFGETGLAIAGGWFSVQSICTQTGGIYIAARARVGARAAFRIFLRLPVTYAVAAGILINVSGARVPATVAKVTQLLAGGGIAVLLLLLGLQLARLTLRAEMGGAALATVIRLFVAPPIAWVTARLLGLEGTALAVAVLQASAPAAVTAALWAMEFDARPTLVSATVVLSTAVSVVTLTLLLAVLLSRV